MLLTATVSSVEARCCADVIEAAGLMAMQCVLLHQPRLHLCIKMCWLWLATGHLDVYFTCVRGVMWQRDYMYTRKRSPLRVRRTVDAICIVVSLMSLN